MAVKRKLAEIYVDITGKLDKLRGTMRKAQVIIKKGMAGLAKWAKRGAIAIGVGLAAGLAYATKAALKQEEAEVNLAAALEVTGEATEKNIRRFKDFAASIQKVTVYGDEDILMLMSLMKNLGVTTDQLESATKQAIGLAAATGRDVKTMAMYIALAKQGEFTMLRRYIPALRATTDATEQLKILTEFTANGFRVAQMQAMSTRGALKQMWNVIGDVAERIGSVLLPRIKDIATQLKEWAIRNQELIGQKFEEYTRSLGTALKKLGGILVWVKGHAKSLKITFIALVSALVAFKLVVASAALITGLKTLVALMGVLGVKIAIATGGISILLYQLVKLRAAWSKEREEREKLGEISTPAGEAAAKARYRKNIAEFRERKKQERELARLKRDLAKQTADTEAEVAKTTKENIKDRIQKWVSMTKRLLGFERHYRWAQKSMLWQEAADFSKFLDNKLSQEQIYYLLRAKLEKERVIAGKERKRAIPEAAAERARVGFMGFQEAWRSIVGQLGEKKIEKEQLAQQKLTVAELRNLDNTIKEEMRTLQLGFGD